MIKFRERITFAVFAVAVLALTACGGGGSSSTDALHGKWVIHGGPPGFSSEYDIVRSGVEFDSSTSGKWLNDSLSSEISPIRHRVTSADAFTWQDLGGGKVRITAGGQAHDYDVSVANDQLTMTQTDGPSSVITVFDKAKP